MKKEYNPHVSVYFDLFSHGPVFQKLICRLNSKVNWTLTWKIPNEFGILRIRSEEQEHLNCFQAYHYTAITSTDNNYTWVLN